MSVGNVQFRPRGDSSLGFLFENPMYLHTLPRVRHVRVDCVDHTCIGWLLITGNLKLCRFLTGNLELLFPTKLVTSVGVDNV